MSGLISNIYKGVDTSENFQNCFYCLSNLSDVNKQPREQQCSLIKQVALVVLQWLIERGGGTVYLLVYQWQQECPVMTEAVFTLTDELKEDLKETS